MDVVEGAAAGGAQELKQAARRVRDAKKKPKSEASPSATAPDESTAPPASAEELRQRVTELEAENERLRQQVKALQDLLAEQG